MKNKACNPGTLPREQFDYLMFHKCQEIVRENGGSVIQGFTVTELAVEGEGAKRL